jgi:hypothetical protein
VRALDRAVGVSASFVGTSTIDKTQSESDIALSVYQRVKAETGTCATAMPSGATVMVDFGGGCTLSSGGLVVGGTVSATVTKDATQVTVTLTDALTVDADQEPLAGTLTLTTPDGSTWSYAADVTLTGVEAKTSALAAGIADQGATLDVKNGSLKGTSGSYAFVLGAVHERFAGCYPDDGMASIGSGANVYSAMFMSDTPQSGDVLFSTASTTMQIALPKRSHCPPPLTTPDAGS